MSKARDLANLLGGGVPSFSGTGAIDVPAGTTEQRPENPNTGYVRFNTSLDQLEQYTDESEWQGISPPPVLTATDVTTLTPSVDQTVVLTGTNFDSAAVAALYDANGTKLTPTTSTRNSSTQITITYTGSDQITADTPEPLSPRVSNGSGLSSQIDDSIGVSDNPIWSTPTGSLGTVLEDVAMDTITLSASDPETGGSITYGVTSGSLPSGVSLNASSGAITGTPNVNDSYNSSGVTHNFSVTATGADGDTTVRAFSIVRKWADGSTSSTAAQSASAIKTLTGTTTNGLYYIDLPNVGVQQVYCDMSQYNGGWMLAMRIDSTLGTGTVRHYFDPSWWASTTYSAAPSNARTNGELITAVYQNYAHGELMLEYGYGSSYFANQAFARYTQPTTGTAQRNNTMRAKMNQNTNYAGDTTTDYRWVKQESNNNTFFPNAYARLNYMSAGTATFNDYFRIWFNDVSDVASGGSACNQIGGFGMSGDFGSYDVSSFRGAYNDTISYSGGNASATISPPYGSDPNTCQWNDTRAAAGTSGLNYSGSTTVRIGSDYYNNGVANIWVR